MLAACHHAEHALEHAQAVSPREYSASGANLWFLVYALERLEEPRDPQAASALRGLLGSGAGRTGVFDKQDAKMQLKRVQQQSISVCGPRVRDHGI